MVCMEMLTYDRPSTVAVSGLLLLWLVYIVLNSVSIARRNKIVETQRGCGTLQRPISWDVTGLYGLFEVIIAAKEHRLLEFWDNNFMRFGPTFGSIRRGRRLIMTSESENFKAVLATNFDDWAIAPLRTGFLPLLGQSIFTMDGKFWQHSRSMLRPQFEKQQVAAVDHLEPHVQNLLAHMPTDGSTIDLQRLFFSFTMDTSSQFLTGTSTDLLDKTKHNEVGREFLASFEASTHDGIIRCTLGWMYWLVPHSKAMKDISISRAAVDHWVRDAMEHKRAVSAGKEKPRQDRYVFLNELAADDRVDAARVRNEILSILVAGRDTTASLLSSLWYLLARHQDVFEKLSTEVRQLNGELPTFDELRNMKYLQYCIQETLRLMPPVPVLGKKAIRDTVLPVGGGQNHKRPIFVPKGSVLFYSFRALMRSEDVFGKDAEVFRPERWEDQTLRPGWSFIPFNGGPRTCLGRSYAQAECAYVTVRLLQSFSKLENRDDEPWTEKLAGTCCSLHGTKVALYN